MLAVVLHVFFIILLCKGLSEEMYKDGYQHITNIDISPTIIKKLQERYKEESANMKCILK